MKYICLSFDDGYYDFYCNALPLLDNYGWKATINVVTGFLDNSIANNYKLLSVKDCLCLIEQGYEVALHSHTHPKKITIDDFKKCLEIAKDLHIIDSDCYGVAIPYNQNINLEIVSYLTKNKAKYISREKCKKHFSFKIIIIKLISLILRTKKNCFLRRIAPFYNSKNQFILNRIDVKEIINNVKPIIKCIPNNCCIIVMLHSIVDDINNCKYPKGAITPVEFDSLLKEMKTIPNLNVITTIEWINIAKNRAGKKAKKN